MHIRRFLFTLFAAVALSPPFLCAQVKTSGTIPSTGGGASCVSINVDAQATVAIQVTGTWTGTLQPELSVQGQSPANTQVTPSTSTTPASTVTANGLYRSSVAGGSTFFVCGNTVASGTAKIYLNATTASAGSGGVGGGSGTVAAGTVGQPAVYTGSTTVGSAWTMAGPIFNFSNYGAVADDVTDNCTVGSGGNAVSAFTAAVNAYSGPGIAVAYIGTGPGDKAYLVQTCSFVFTNPVTLVNSGTLDFGTNSGANGIQIGPTGLLTYQTPAKPYTLTGWGTIVGGGSLTSAVISIEKYLTEVQVTQQNFINAGGASNWVIKQEDTSIGIPGLEISHLISWNNDSVAGRNFMKLVSTGTGGTAHIHDVHIVGDNGSVPNTACGGTGAWLGSPYLRVTDLEVFAYGANIILSNAGGSVQSSLHHLVLDDNNCTRGGVQAPIQLGDPGITATVSGVALTDSEILTHAGDSAIFALTNDTTGANITTLNFSNNQVGGTTPLAAGSILTTVCNDQSNCVVYGNQTINSINNGVPTIYSGDATHSIRGYYDGSEYVFTANSGTQFQIGGGHSFNDPFTLFIPSTGEIQNVPLVSGSPAGQVTLRGFNQSKASKSFAGCETTGGITTLSTVATTTDTGQNCLPANAIIDAVVYRITTTITTAANFTIGDATTAARFCSTQSVLTASTTGVCFVQADQTGAAGPRQTSAAKVRVTTNVNPGAGAIRLIVYYHTWTAPTS